MKAPERTDRVETQSGYEVAPVYTPVELQEIGFDYDADLGLPGEVPYTRGFAPEGYRKKLWDIEMYAGFGSAEDANKRFRYLIEHGSTGGVSIALDLPTQIGLDSDHPMAIDEVGQAGVALSSYADIQRLFDGISLEKAHHVFTTANCISPIAAAWFLTIAEEHGTPTSDFVIQIQNDPIKEYIARGTQFLPIEASVRLAIDMFEYVRGSRRTGCRSRSAAPISSRPAPRPSRRRPSRSATALHYVEEMLRRGMRIDDFGSALEFHFTTEMDFFEEVAKYRVVRKVWTQLVRERFGGTTPEAQRFRLHAATSGRPLTAQQPLNNISRITLQILAQILGGCEQTRTASFDEALGIPTELAARTSIRANQIIAYESGVPATVDPLGGSYYVESLTKRMEETIWSIIQAVDERGGAIAAARQGYYQDILARGAYRYELAVENAERIIVGVNKFTVEEETEIAVFEHDDVAVERQLERLGRLKDERDQSAVDASLARLRAICRTDENVMPAVLDCVRAYATTGEIANVWREVFGEYVSASLHLGR